MFNHRAERILVFLVFFAAGMVFGAPAGGSLGMVSVLDFGAKGDGVADDTKAIQAALNAAKGKDGTAEGRTVFSLYFPSIPGGFYRVTDSLLVDGTHGLVIYGDGALTKRDRWFKNEKGGYEATATIRWYGKESKPVFWVKGGTGMPSNPNFQITFRDLTISGYRENLPMWSNRHDGQAVESRPMPPDAALSGIHFGNLAGAPDNTLCRRAIIENVYISNCRFGIWSGNPDGLNTDHATILITGCSIFLNAQAGIYWGTGNAIVNVISCDIGSNGWAGKAFAADAYSSPIGANIHVNSGYMDIVSLTSAGHPTDADIYQQSGRVSIINAWSDTVGYFFYQAGASQNEGGYHNGQVTGVRHYAGIQDFFDNTPNSMRITCPGMFVSGCLVYGNIEVVSGLSGRPVFAGINFIRKGATFIGSGVDTQRSLTVLGNAGNNAQILLGGANKGVPLTHRGSAVPQILSMGDNPALFQVLGATENSTGLSFHTRTDDANGANTLLMNGYFTAAGVQPLQADKMVWWLEVGGSQGLRIRGFDPAGKTDEIPFASFVDFGGLRVAPLSGYRNEVTFQPPARSGPPSFSSGDFWLGSIYYDTAAKKLRVNTGGSTWLDLH